MKERERSTGSIILNRLPIQFLPPERVPQVQGSSQLKVGTSQSQTTALTLTQQQIK
jgi:multidrug efflux pump subunit AcrB